MIFRLYPLLPIFSVLLCAPLARAASSSSHLTCNGSDNQPNSSVLAFDFDVKTVISSGGSGGGAGKPTYAMTVQIPLGSSSSYEPVYKIASGSKHIPSCVLTKPIDSSTITITMSTVQIADLHLLSGDFFLGGVAGPRLQMSLAFESVSVQAAP